MDIKYLIVLIVIVCLMFLTYHVYQTQPITYIICIGIMTLAIVYLIKYNTDPQPESMEHMQVSGEAIQNVGSIYNNEKMIIKDLQLTGKFNYLPTGIVCAWNGKTAPEGWALCDGTNGTPDLRGRFILGCNSDMDGVNGTSTDGGASNINTGARIDKKMAGDLGMTGGETVHTVTNGEMPLHVHAVNDWAEWTTGGVRYGNVTHRAGFDRRGQEYTANVFTYNSQFDSDSSPSGGSKPHNNIPPYYVLAYIMKL